jgi:hypothetical protein
MINSDKVTKIFSYHIAVPEECFILCSSDVYSAQLHCHPDNITYSDFGVGKLKISRQVFTPFFGNISVLNLEVKRF